MLCVAVVCYVSIADAIIHVAALAIGYAEVAAAAGAPATIQQCLIVAL
jgi:hypothetical protein